MCLHANQNAYMTCNSNCYIKTDRLLKLTGSHFTLYTWYYHGMVRDMDIITKITNNEVIHVLLNSTIFSALG